MIKKVSKTIIIKSMLIFASLLPIIQATQLYILFDLFNPVLLIMPVIVGNLLGFLIGLYRYKVLVHIQDLELIKKELSTQVSEQTKELHKKNKELEQMLLLDPLTGVGNRLMLKKILEEESQSLGNIYSFLSIFMIDIDYFKMYNDYYGHLGGDDVLKKIAYSLEEALKDSASIMRFGGEEFIVIAKNCDKKHSIKIAQIILQTISDLKIEHVKSEVNKYVSVSVGVDTITAIDMSSKSQVINNADKALYLAKMQGRNCFVHN